MAHLLRPQLKRWQLVAVIFPAAVLGGFCLIVATVWSTYLVDRIGFPDATLPDSMTQGLLRSWLSFWHIREFSMPVTVADVLLAAQFAWNAGCGATAPALVSRAGIVTSWLLVIVLAAWRVYIFVLLWSNTSVSPLGKGVYALLILIYTVFDPSFIGAVAMLRWSYMLRWRSQLTPMAVNHE